MESQSSLVAILTDAVGLRFAPDVGSAFALGIEPGKQTQMDAVLFYPGHWYRFKADATVRHAFGRSRAPLGPPQKQKTFPQIPSVDPFSLHSGPEHGLLLAASFGPPSGDGLRGPHLLRGFLPSLVRAEVLEICGHDLDDDDLFRRAADGGPFREGPDDLRGGSGGLGFCCAV